jgi:hypothetical protein
MESVKHHPQIGTGKEARGPSEARSLFLLKNLKGEDGIFLAQLRYNSAYS